MIRPATGAFGEKTMRTLHTGSVAGCSAAATFAEPATAPAAPGEKREWTISEMARDFGLTLRALRFYEARGLIAPLRFGGARFYTPKDRARLQLILTAKKMGFTLTETAAMLGDAGNGAVESLPLSPQTVETQIAFLENQRSAIEDALGTLRQHRTELAQSAA